MKQGIETRAIHAGQSPDPTTGAIMTPIFQTSTYVQAGPGEHKGYEYSRTQNPTRAALEANLASLEGGAHGLAFASGCATMTTILHTLMTGDHVICADDVYGGTFRLLDKVFRQFGIDTSFVDLTDASALDRVVSYLQSAKAKQIFVAFRNIDRFENARYVMGQLGIEA